MALLEGLRVVEVALLAPNSVGMHLADLGAEVIKVEEPGRGDYTRSVGAARLNGVSFLHLRWNRGKRSTAIDLRHPDGVEVFRDLVGRSEVVIEGLRAGALARRGVGFEDLRAMNPSIVFCSLSGFGQTGPYRDLATHGVAYDAYAAGAPPETIGDGFTSIPAGYQDIGTQAGGLYAALAILAAVLRARATGEGEVLDVAQADAAVSWNASRIDPILSNAPKSQGQTTMHGSVRYQYYRTSDGRHILFQASERQFFERFCRAVGREDLLVAGVGAEVGEHARGDVGLRRELAGIFSNRTQAEWVQFFIRADVPGGPVHSATELLEDPQFIARAQLIEHRHPEAGPVRMLGTPIRTSGLPAPVRPAPATGADTVAVLSRILGYGDDRIADLRRRGVIG
ncbi:MAG: CaiB/BaiF CoA transferase family protein [Acidimicrobiales bacterium]